MPRISLGPPHNKTSSSPASDARKTSDKTITGRDDAKSTDGTREILKSTSQVRSLHDKVPSQMIGWVVRIYMRWFKGTELYASDTVSTLCVRA